MASRTKGESCAPKCVMASYAFTQRSGELLHAVVCLVDIETAVMNENSPVNKTNEIMLTVAGICE